MVQARIPSSAKLISLIMMHILHAASFARAEQTSMSFDSLLEQAMTASPLVQQIEEAVVQQKATGIGMKTLPNAQLFGETKPYVDHRESNDVEYEIGLEQSIRPSDFGARSELAGLIAKASAVEQKLKLKEFEQGLLLAYGKAWALQEKTEFTQQALGRGERFVGSLRDLGEQGVVPESTAKLALAETKKLALELRAIDGDRERALGELVRRSGVSLSGRRLEKPIFQKLPSTISKDAGAAPLLFERVRLGAELGRAEEKLARLDAFPKFAPRLAFEHTSDGDDRINVGISIELPFSDRNQAGRMQAAAKSRSAQSQLRYLEAGRLSEEIALLLGGARSSIEQADRLQSEVIPLLEQSLSAAERELEAGQGNPIQIWQTLSELAMSHDRFLELWMKGLSERVELSILLGENV